MPKRLGRLVSVVGWVAAVTSGILLLAGTDRTVVVLSAWVGVTALADLIRVPSPSGGRLSLIGGAGLVGVVLIESVPVLAGVFLLGLALSHLILALWASEPSSDTDLLRTIAGLGVLILVEIGDEWLTSRFDAEPQWASLGVILVAGFAWFVADAVVRMLEAAPVGQASIRYVWLAALEDWPVMVALFASAGLFALAEPIIGWWALPVAVVPYAISHVSFTLLAGTRRTYGQMIRALSRLPEVASMSPDGHAAGTALLASTMARSMGMHPGDVTELEYAALLHDIGRITVEETAEEPEQADLARWGAEIIRQAPYLEVVADHVEKHGEPYRRPGEENDPSIGLAPRIIKVASTFDKAHRIHGMEPVEALEVLHRRTAYDYDPAVVARLRSVLRRSGRLSA